jgi:hypothetical protein
VVAAHFCGRDPAASTEHDSPNCENENSEAKKNIEG